MKTLSHWLSQVVGEGPIQNVWRAQIGRRWKYGVGQFKKIPVIRPDGDRSVLSEGPLAGVARPLACPEPALEGTEFTLYGFDGFEWSHQDTLLPFNHHSSNPAIISKHRLLLENAMEDAPGIWNLIQIFALRIAETHYRTTEDPETQRPSLPFLPSWPPVPNLRKSLSDLMDMDDIAAVFAAGVMYGRSQIYPGKRNVGRPEERDWKEVIFHALERHGQTVEPREMVRKLKGKEEEFSVADPRDPHGSKLIERRIRWNDGTFTDLEIFQRHYRACRKKRPIRSNDRQ